MNDLVQITDGKTLPKGPAGGVVAVLVPGKWVLWISPVHPAWADMFNMELQSWPTKEIEKFMNMEGCPHVAKEYAKVLLARRNGGS